jgi:hypothetical protein
MRQYDQRWCICKPVTAVRHYRLVLPGMLRGVVMLGLLLLGSGAFAPSVVAQERSQPSCDPRILVQRYGSGETEMSGSGEGFATLIVLSDTTGASLPDTTGTISWSYRAYVREVTGKPRVSHDIGGYLTLDIATAAGQRISFRSHCIAGAGTFQLPSSFADGYSLLYANGVATGWPTPLTSPSQGIGARLAFVHFEAMQHPDGTLEIYVALVEGQDCALNHDVLVWTPYPPPVLGSGAHSALNRTSYVETDCALLGGPGRSLPGSPVGIGRIQP